MHNILENTKNSNSNQRNFICNYWTNVPGWSKRISILIILLSLLAQCPFLEDKFTLNAYK